MIEKPLLAGKAPDDLTALEFPMLASPKLDGVRCIIRNGRAVSRKFKDIPNEFVQQSLRGLPDGLDGELILADPTAPFREVSSAVMAKGGEPDFVYAVFDCADQDTAHVAFSWRFRRARRRVRGFARVEVVPHYTVSDHERAAWLAYRFVQEGFEGMMLRDPNGRYKFGRSTMREGILLKVKNFADEEAVVVGSVERMHNANEAKRNAVGAIERSTAKGGKVPMGTLGALVCQFADGARFEVGTGFSDAERAELWRDRIVLPGRVAKIKHQPAPGGRQPGEAPRFPVFLGWREE